MKTYTLNRYFFINLILQMFRCLETKDSLQEEVNGKEALSEYILVLQLLLLPECSR